MGKKGSDDEADSCVLLGTALADLLPGNFNLDKTKSITTHFIQVLNSFRGC
jgi:hypothetical protein